MSLKLEYDFKKETYDLILSKDVLLLVGHTGDDSDERIAYVWLAYSSHQGGHVRD